MIWDFGLGRDGIERCGLRVASCVVRVVGVKRKAHRAERERVAGNSLIRMPWMIVCCHWRKMIFY